MRHTAAFAAALLGAALLFAPRAADARSFVGKKLPRGVLVDLRGHAIDPADYEGSVLVVYGGIPW